MIDIKKYCKKGAITLLGIASAIGSLQLGYKGAEFIEDNFSSTPAIIRNYDNAYKQSPLEILTKVGNTTKEKIASAIEPKPTGCEALSKEWGYDEKENISYKLIYCVEKENGKLSTIYTFQ